MIPNPWPGSHFVFEGIDGCGKSQQVDLALQFFRKNLSTPQASSRVVTTKEPDNRRTWGNRIYKDLYKPRGLHTTNPVGLQAWFALDSRENYINNIIENLKTGDVVLSDRSRPSMVFGAESENQIGELMHLNTSILGEHFIWPDAIFIFDVNVETALQRIKEKRRKLDGHENAKVMSRVRHNYLAFAKTYPNCHVINAELSSHEVFKDVEKIMTAVLELKK